MDTATGKPTRIGYLAVSLPVGVPEVSRPNLIRQLVIDALATSGEWPARVEIVTHQRTDNNGMQRWFVEFETGCPGVTTP
jgi:hypothetical protein